MSSKQKMHWIVLGWVCLFFGFAVTLPIAMKRVSETEKFAAQHLNSLTCAGKSTKERVVTFFANCAAMKIEPIKSTKK